MKQKRKKVNKKKDWSHYKLIECVYFFTFYSIRLAVPVYTFKILNSAINFIYWNCYYLSICVIIQSSLFIKLLFSMKYSIKIQIYTAYYEVEVFL